MRNQNAKVEAVVKSLIKIRSEDGEAKSLVFSTWTGFHPLALKQVLFLWFSDVLDILGAALDENNIPYASLHNRLKKSKIFEANLRLKSFQRGHHTRQLQEESAKVQKQRGC